MKHRIRTLCAVFVTVFALSNSWGQTRRTPPAGQESLSKARVLPNFDIRKVQPEARLAAEQAQAATVVEERLSALASFQATPEEASNGTRVVPNPFGLPKIYRREGAYLTSRSSLKPEEIARGFLQNQSRIFALTPADVGNLRVVVEDATAQAVFLAFNQNINGIDVYNGQIKFTLTKGGEVVQVGAGDVIGNLNLSTQPKLTPISAVRAAFAANGIAAPTLTPLPDSHGKSAFQNPLGGRYRPITAELSILPMTASSARLAYRVFLESGPEAFYEILVDADSGGLLLRHNLYKFSGQARVWTQSPMVGERTLVSFPDPSTNFPAGWLGSGVTVTKGNNVDAFLDATGDDSPDSVSNANMTSGRAFSTTQNFDFPFGDGTVLLNPKNFQPSSVTNVFYYVNIAHDYFYGLGFNEAAGNFQSDNFGRGGLGTDAIQAEAQYGGFTSNSSFAPAPDGEPGIMRLGIFTRGTATTLDDLDSAYDGQLVIHEYGHGVTSRLIGARVNTDCLDGVQSAALSEAWSDYFAISYFNNPVMGAYVLQNPISGIRRQSYEGYTFTYEDFGNTGYKVHDDGEIWAATLWDLRKALGQATTDRLVVDGLKATPCNPSMTDARDAILSADQANNAGANRTAIWTVFARHGLGYSAVGVDGDILLGVRYDAATDLPPTTPPSLNPAITSNPLSTRTGLGDRYSYKVAASNPANGVLNYVLNAGPTGMTVDASTGQVSWVAGFTYERVKITVTDGKGGKVVHGYLLPILTVLANNAPVVIAGDKNTIGFAAILVPANAPVLQLKLRGGTGDTDMYVITPDDDFAASVRDGTTETLSFANPTAGPWFIEVYGYAAYSGVSLSASVITPTLLSGAASLSSLAGDISSETFYRVAVPPGASSLTVSTSGGTGDVDIFLRKSAPAVCQDPSSTSAPCEEDKSSESDGNSETITVNNPAAGDWYLDLLGFDAYSGVKLDVRLAISPITINLSTGGSAVMATTGTAPQVTTAYATADVNGTAPFGTAVFGLSQNGIVVSEAGIPASPPTQSARIFVDYRTNVASGSGTINIYTGFAIVNRGTSSASLTYMLRDRSGQTVALGHGDLAAGAHVAKFIQELKDIAPDFSLPANFPTATQYGSLEITSSQPVSVLALRLTPNQRGDVLLTSTPIADLTQPVNSSTLYFPQLVDGGGYTTSVTLLNTSGAAESGTLSIFDDTGAALSVRSKDGVTGSSFTYSISAGGAFVFQTDGSPSSARVGWVRVTPNAGNTSPSGAGIFSYSSGGILITESGVPAAVPTTRARVYVDRSKGHNTGLALASPGSAADVTLQAYQSNGTSPAGNGSAILKLTANGHKSAFVPEVISGLPDDFTGEAELTSTNPFVALTLRSLNNSRGDFLLTTFPMADGNQTAPTPIVFPHIANGGGYTTQFIFVNATGSSAVTLSFFGDDGSPLFIEHNP